MVDSGLAKDMETSRGSPLFLFICLWRVHGTGKENLFFMFWGGYCEYAN